MNGVQQFFVLCSFCLCQFVSVCLFRGHLIVGFFHSPQGEWTRKLVLLVSSGEVLTWNATSGSSGSSDVISQAKILQSDSLSSEFSTCLAESGLLVWNTG